MNFELICWCINLHQKVWYKSEKAFGLWPEWHYTTREIGGWIHIITSPSLYHWWGVCEVYASHGTQDFSEAICEKWSKTNRKAKSVWEEKASYGPYQNTIEAERKQKHSTWSRKEVKTRQTDRIWTMYTCTLTRPTSRSESRKPGARDIPLKQYWSRKRVSCTKLTHICDMSTDMSSNCILSSEETVDRAYSRLKLKTIRFYLLCKKLDYTE